ncbi:MAG: hypothetical protein GWP04_12130 [Gammaproteobacteria bacterium]|nr:hypothetical protein [Gammaproteobacteria bacterium]
MPNSHRYGSLGVRFVNELVWQQIFAASEFGDAEARVPMREVLLQLA